MDWEAVTPALKACQEAGVPAFNVDTDVREAVYGDNDPIGQLPGWSAVRPGYDVQIGRRPHCHYEPFQYPFHHAAGVGLSGHDCGISPIPGGKKSAHDLGAGSCHGVYERDFILILD